MRKVLFLVSLIVLSPACNSLDEIITGENTNEYEKVYVQNCLEEDCNQCEISRPTNKSLVVVGGPRPVNSGSLWNGWQEIRFNSSANSNGAVYPVMVRYNRSNQPCNASLLTMVGGANGGWTREGYTYGASFEDRISSNLGIRTIEIQYVGGSDIFPRNGWNNISSAVADVIGWMIDNGIIEGELYGYGNSGGSCMMANTLVNQKLAPKYGGSWIPFDGMILGGGPFGIDFLTTGCLLSEINAYCFEDVGGCDTASDYLKACRSTISPDSRLNFEDNKILRGTDVAVMVGTTDPRRVFISGEAQLFLSKIKARTESFSTPNAPHQILNTTAGRNAMEAVLTQWINN